MMKLYNLSLCQHKMLKNGIQSMLPDHIGVVSELLAAAFMEKNKLWGSFSIKKEKLVVFFQQVIRKHLRSQQLASIEYGRKVQLCMINVKDGQIRGCMMHYSLTQYMATRDSQPQLEQFRHIQMAGKQLMKAVNISSYPHQSVAFGTFAAVFAKQPISIATKIQRILEYFQKLKESGIRWVLGRYSNPKALEIQIKLGGKLINKVMLEYEGRKFPLFLAQLDLYNPTVASLESQYLQPKL